MSRGQLAIRSFTRLVCSKPTGLPPFEYIRRERLTASAHALREHKHRVLDVALDYVFDSHAGFSRAFANGFGISPRQFAGYPEPDGWLIPFHYLNRKEEIKTMDQTYVIFTQIVERPERKLILRRSKTGDDYFSYTTEIGCAEQEADWDFLSQISEALYEPVGLWLPPNLQPEGTGIYAQGVEVPADYDRPVPDRFDILLLAPCKMLVFQGEPYDDRDFETHVSFCMERIAQFNPEAYGYRYAPELAPRMQLMPLGWRGYIEMTPVEQV